MFDILLIVNKLSGSYNQNRLEEVISILKTKADSVTVKYTEYKGHAREIAENAEYDLIIAAGGDGTINETAGGIAGTPKMFYAIPFGTANVFCSEYGIGSCPVKAAKKMNIKHPVTIPAGYVNEHFFILMAGFGFDAHTVLKVEQADKIKKTKYKKISHIINGLKTIFKDKFERLVLHNNGKKEVFYHGIFSVSACYGGAYKLGRIEKDKINAFLVLDNSRSSLFKSFLSLFLGFGFKGKSLVNSYFKIDNVSYCQIDGEYVDLLKSSAYISIKYNAINFVLPDEKLKN